MQHGKFHSPGPGRMKYAEPDGPGMGGYSPQHHSAKMDRADLGGHIPVVGHQQYGNFHENNGHFFHPQHPGAGYAMAGGMPGVPGAAAYSASGKAVRKSGQKKRPQSS